MIRIDRIWVAVDPMDMRAGLEATLARVVRVFGAAHPHHAYVFANRRATRVKVLVHDGIGVWLALRHLNQGKFVWPAPGATRMELSDEQIGALVLGLPWQRLGAAGVIDRI
ncbi:IS66 family insertion sequence element accessory protein TnpB [Castellaniella sp. UC4442_H9]